MSDSLQTSFDQLCDYARETALLSSIASLLEWDERTMMPEKAGPYRAEQIPSLAGRLHERWTDPRLGELVGQLSESSLADDRHSDIGTTIREIKRQYDKKTKLPQALVEEIARTSVLGQQAWQRARQDDDFAAFRPLLEKTVTLKQQEADALGYDECRYDALLDDFEPGESTSNVRRVLEGLREELVPLVAELTARTRRPDTSILRRNYPVEAQATFGVQAADRIGFDFDAGRLDVTAHPFCAGMGPLDCRLTTHYYPEFFPAAFFGTLHEAGHGIYDQGLRTDQYGLPPGDSVSLGIHESQSRMWENLVGRSRSFWEHFFPAAQKAFPGALSEVSVDDFFFAINNVEPSLIRIEADEATYNLHILIRFELEQALVHDELAVADLPAAWNEKYQGYLGISPPNDADGVLQDIHWSGGALGYFPTYSLGNLYASQFFEQAGEDLGDLDDMFRRGEFAPLRVWLRENIHRPGCCYSAAELVEKVTGKPLSHAPLMRHLRSKLGTLYGVEG